MKNKVELTRRQRNLEEDSDGKDPIIEGKLRALAFILGDGDPITDIDMKPPSTDADLDEIIAQLKLDRTSIREFSMFGDPNWKIIDAQIQICEWAKGD